MTLLLLFAGSGTGVAVVLPDTPADRIVYAGLVGRDVYVPLEARVVTVDEDEP